MLVRSAEVTSQACAVAWCAAAYVCELELTRPWPALQYSFGVLLYEMVTGERAWAGMTHVQVGHPGLMSLVFHASVLGVEAITGRPRRRAGRA